jgi:hypothetical protein
MIHGEWLILEKDHHEQGEYRQGNDFLNHFQLPQIKWTAVFVETDPVCRNLERVFKERYAPTNQNDTHQAQVIEPIHFLEFQMSIPGKGHEAV